MLWLRLVLSVSTSFVILESTSPVLVPWKYVSGSLLIFSSIEFLRLYEIFVVMPDMMKPWPVRASEKWLPGGYGIMIDDVLAAVYAMACLWLLRWLWPGLL